MPKRNSAVIVTFLDGARSEYFASVTDFCAISGLTREYVYVSIKYGRMIRYKKRKCFVDYAIEESLNWHLAYKGGKIQWVC